MKYLITIAIFSGLLRNTHSLVFYSTPKAQQEVKAQWDSTKNWRLYKLHNFNTVFRIPADSLHYLQSNPLSDDSIHIFLTGAKKIEGVNPVWQGCYLASYETSNGEIRKAIISHYAGFFYCQPDNVYFQVNPTLQREWLKYLSESYVNIHRADTK